MLNFRLGARTFITKLKLRKYFQFRLRFFLLLQAEGSGVNAYARSVKVHKQQEQAKHKQINHKAQQVAVVARVVVVESASNSSCVQKGEPNYKTNV